MALIAAAPVVFASAADDRGPGSEDALVEQVFSLTRNYLAEFQHPQTGVLYGARLRGSDRWTRPAEVLAEKPHPWGYGSRIADTVLHTGHLLVALLDAHEARPDPFLREQIGRCFKALQFIGSLPETHPKPGKPALEGLVPRGPHPDDPSAYFDDSSMDQHTTYIISLAVYARSPLATAEEKAWIRESLGKVGRRLEGNGWSIKRADGVTQAHVGFSWKGFNSNHASILLPAVLALYQGTGDEHWRERYEFFLAEADGKRWQQVHPGPQVRINGHPIYANQNAFRVYAWHRFEENADRRTVIGGLLEQSTRMQLERDFPGEFYRKYHDAETWQRVRDDFDWGDAELRGAAVAWEKFRPEMLVHEKSGLAALAHIRFPLGGFHMVLLSKHPALLRQHAPAIWNMLSAVELEKVEAGETHYLFTVAALHLYAHFFRNPDLFAEGEDDARPAPYGEPLPIRTSAGIGAVQDIAVDGDLAFAIGRSRLQVLDISDASRPEKIGELAGLGSVRQIAVARGVAYITSRQDGLFIVDVSAPEKPQLLAHYDTVEFATGVALSGSVLFVACRHYGVELIDVRDPQHPSHVSLVRTGEAQSVVARNGFLYAGVWGSSEVVAVDVRNPWEPEITAKVPLDGYGDGVDVEGGFLYVATGHHSKETPRKNPGDPGFGKGHGLEVFDIADPAQPVFVSRVKFPPLYEIGNDTWRVTVANDHAFVADTWNGAFVLDVADPRAMKFVGRCELPVVEARGRRDYVGGLALVRDHIYLAGGYTDLHVVAATGIAERPIPEEDISPGLKGAPAHPADDPKRGRIYRPQGQVYSVGFLDNDLAVVACGQAGVHLVKLWPEIERVAELASDGFASDVSVSGDRVFVAEGAGGLAIFELEESGERLKRIGRLELKGRAVRQVEVPDSGERILIQAGANQFLIVDVSDPAKPTILFEDKRHGLLYGDQMMRGLIEDRYAAVFWHVSGHHWYDLRANPKPVFSGDNFAERTGSSNGLVAFGDKTLATLRGGYLLLDRQEKRSLGELDVHRVGNPRAHPGVPNIAGDRLFIANRSNGLITIADITDPKDPQLIEQFTTPGNPGRIASRNGSIVIPNGNYGLWVIDPE